MTKRFRTLLFAALLAAPAAAQTGPSFDCSKASSDVELTICADPALAALDRELAALYAYALIGDDMNPERQSELIAVQRGWIKGRDECWKASDPHACVADQYRSRIVELQARYALVKATGPVFYSCDGNPANEVVVTFYATDPPTLIAERGDQVSFMTRAPAASGAKYAGRNESFWEHQGEATVVWGYEAPRMRCKPRPAAD